MKFWFHQLLVSQTKINIPVVNGFDGVKFLACNDINDQTDDNIADSLFLSILRSLVHVTNWSVVSCL